MCAKHKQAYSQMEKSHYLGTVHLFVFVLIHFTEKVWWDFTVPHKHVAVRKALLQVDHLNIKHKHSTARYLAIWS